MYDIQSIILGCIPGHSKVWSREHTHPYIPLYLMCTYKKGSVTSKEYMIMYQYNSMCYLTGKKLETRSIHVGDPNG